MINAIKNISAFFVIALVFFSFSPCFTLASFPEADDLLDYNELLTKKGIIIEYVYTGEEILAEKNEILKNRRSDAIFYQKEKTMAVKIFSGDTMIFKNNKWFSLEYATTTRAEFNDFYVKKSLINEASAGTIYTTNDGDIENNGTVWSTVWNAASGVSISSALNWAGGAKVDGTTYYIARGVLTFDTSIIGAGSEVSAGNIFLYKNDTAGTYSINIYNCTDYGSLGVEDYSAPGSTEQSTAKTQSDLGAGYNDFELNAAGINNIDPAGNSFFSVREVGHDVGNSPFPTWTGFWFETSAYAGTTRDPYLYVEYTEPPLPPDTGTTTKNILEVISYEEDGTTYYYAPIIFVGLIVVVIAGLIIILK